MFERSTIFGKPAEREKVQFAKPQPRVEKSRWVLALEDLDMPNGLRSYVFKAMHWNLVYNMTKDILNSISVRFMDGRPMMLKPVIMKTLEESYEGLKAYNAAGASFDIEIDEFTKYWLASVLYYAMNYSTTHNVQAVYPRLDEVIFKVPKKDLALFKSVGIAVSPTGFVSIGASFTNDDPSQTLNTACGEPSYEPSDYKAAMTRIEDGERGSAEMFGPVIEEVVQMYVQEFIQEARSLGMA